MEKETIQVNRPKSLWRRLAPWIGGIVLGAVLIVFGQIYYKLGIVGGYTYHALQFIERDFVDPHPRYSIYIDGKRAPAGIFIDISDGAFMQIVFSGPVYSTSPRAVYRLVPRASAPGYREYHFEIDGDCHAVFEIRGTEPAFLGCTGRDFISD